MTLADFLSKNGLSHSAFAEKIGVSQAAVNRYAKGRRIPRPAVLARIRKETSGIVTADDFMLTVPEKAA
jgi:transcriptional regulator with XRE-family HTH domain